MSGMYIVLERQIEGVDGGVDGKGVSHAEPQLAKIAKKLGVTPLMEFFSASPEDLEGIDAGITNAPPAQFFDGKEGLKTVQALRSYLEKNPKEVKNSGWVVGDLKEYEAILSKAAEMGVRWHLAIDI